MNKITARIAKGFLGDCVTCAALGRTHAAVVVLNGLALCHEHYEPELQRLVSALRAGLKKAAEL